MSCNILIDPRVKLGSEFIIEGSDYIDSTPYKVVGIQISGTTWRGQWRMMLDCLPPDYKAPE